MKHTSQDNFIKDLKRGRDIEEFLLNKIKNKYPCATLIDGKFKDYDLFIPETNKKIEIKGDYRSCETGNIIIELSMYDKPSALLTTKADYWIIFTGQELLYITPIKIIECILTNNIQSRKLTGFGDTQPKIACLIKIDLFKKYCFKTTELIKNETH